MNVPFTRLVRFKSSDGQTLYGEAGADWQKDLRGQTVDTFSGQNPWDPDFKLSGQKAVVSEVSIPYFRGSTPSLFKRCYLHCRRSQ